MSSQHFSSIYIYIYYRYIYIYTHYRCKISQYGIPEFVYIHWTHKVPDYSLCSHVCSTLSVSNTSSQVGADEPVHYRFDNLVVELQASTTQSLLVRGVVLTAYPY